MMRKWKAAIVLVLMILFFGGLLLGSIARESGATEGEALYAKGHRTRVVHRSRIRHHKMRRYKMKVRKVKMKLRRKFRHLFHDKEGGR